MCFIQWRWWEALYINKWLISLSAQYLWCIAQNKLKICNMYGVQWQWPQCIYWSQNMIDMTRYWTNIIGDTQNVLSFQWHWYRGVVRFPSHGWRHSDHNLGTNNYIWWRTYSSLGLRELTSWGHCTYNKSAKGAYKWNSPVCLSMCEGSEYMSLSVTKRKIILNVTISKLLVLVRMSGIWFGVYINNISALV